MVAEPRELVPAPIPRTRPSLAVVPPPPPRRVVAVTLFVILLIGAIGYPVFRTVLEGPPPIPAFEPRPPAATAIADLGPFAPAPAGSRPRSPRPVPGIAFVRCTRLWTALPDGEQERPILDMTGITAPAFSPDARSIAFARHLPEGVEFWLTAADGSKSRKLGTIGRDQLPDAMRVGGLAWSRDGENLAFGLTDATYGAMSGGSAVWTLHLPTGEFERVGSGWPVPSWNGGRVTYGTFNGWQDMNLTTPNEIQGQIAKNLSSSDMDYASASVDSSWMSSTRTNGVVVLRESPEGETVLAVRKVSGRQDQAWIAPPEGFTYPRFAQPAIFQDGSRAVIDLLDAGGGRDLGMVNLETEEWTLLDYAWDPSTSPVPTLLGPLEATHAEDVVRDLLWNWQRNPERSDMLSATERDPSLLPWRSMYVMPGKPERRGDTWVFETVTSGRVNGKSSYRTLRVSIRPEHGRLLGTVTPTSELMPLETIDHALAYIEKLFGWKMPYPHGIPDGAKLGKWPVDAWSYRGDSTAMIHLDLPGKYGKGRMRWDRSMSFGMGDVDFSLGCGGENDPEPVTIGSTVGEIDHMEGTTQVIWPSGTEGVRFTVYGHIPEEMVMETAEAIEAGR